MQFKSRIDLFRLLLLVNVSNSIIIQVITLRRNTVVSGYDVFKVVNSGTRLKNMLLCLWSLVSSIIKK